MEFSTSNHEPLSSSSVPYNLDNDPKKTPRSISIFAVAAGGTVLVTLFLWLTLGWHTAIFALVLCVLATLYHLATTHTMSPFRIYYLIDEAKNEVIKEPRVYTQDDMEQLDAGLSTTKDWASVSGAYVEQHTQMSSTKELQLIFASPVSRPVGRFWSKPKSLLWTISGYGSDFALQEGLISETGKCYWVEQHDFTENKGRILKLVQGHWNYETREFVGNFVDSNGSMGSYPTLVRQR